MTPADLEALAVRMTARPLAADCDGGEWFAVAPDATDTKCEACGQSLAGLPHVASIGHALLALCVPCAVADCERAEGDWQPINPPLRPGQVVPCGVSGCRKPATLANLRGKAFAPESYACSDHATEGGA